MNEHISRSKLKWHGNEVKVEIVYVKVFENKEKPLYWYNYEIHLDTEPTRYALIEACKITAEGQTFYISNHHGIGIRKLRKGGWPNHQHFSLPDDSESDHKVHLPNTSYSSANFVLHEQRRRIWQRRNHPKEFERSERLRKLI